MIESSQKNPAFVKSFQKLIGWNYKGWGMTSNRISNIRMLFILTNFC
jgi:hypothetical protein